MLNCNILYFALDIKRNDVESINFIYKYYPIITAMLFMFVYSALFCMMITERIDLIDNAFIRMILLLFVTVIAVLVEMVVFMVYAFKNNVLWGILIYFFNVFIIPYYTIKYIVKENKYNFNSCSICIINYFRSMCSIILLIIKKYKKVLDTFFFILNILL